MIPFKERHFRVLHIGCIPPEIGGPSPGGVATHVWELAKESQKRGYAVYIVGNGLNSVEKDGIKIFSLQRNKLIKGIQACTNLPMLNNHNVHFFDFLDYKTNLSALFWAGYLRNILKGVKPDVIHIHDLFHKSVLGLEFIGNRIPLVITGHGFWQGLKDDASIAMAKFALDYADHVICVSQFEKEQFKHYFPSHEKKLRVIHNPISPDKIPFLESEEIRSNLGLAYKKVIFFSGVIEPVKRKGLDILLKAIANDGYLRQNIKLVVITNRETLDYAQKFAKQERIDALILVSQPWDRIVQFYNAADVFVMPSRSEGFSMVYEESLLAGTPIVGFYRNLNELEDLLGVYIGEKFNSESEDEGDLARKIRTVLETDFDRQLLRKTVIENLSWSAKFAQFDDIYREAMLKTEVLHD